MNFDISSLAKSKKELVIIVYVLLAFSAYLAFSIRLSNIPGLIDENIQPNVLINPFIMIGPLFNNNFLGMGGSLTGLDPYYFFQAMEHILSQGVPPVINYKQYLPIGFPMRYANILISYFGSLLFDFFHLFSSSVSEVAAFSLYPPIAAIFEALLIFFIVLELTDNYFASIFGSIVFSVFQTHLSRTSAGFSTKTALGYAFIYLAILLLIKQIKSKERKQKLLFGTLLFVVLGLDALTSGYVDYLFITLPIFYVVLLLFGINDKDTYTYLLFPVWSLILIIALFSFTLPFTGKEAISAISEVTVLGWYVWILALVVFVLNIFLDLNKKIFYKLNGIQVVVLVFLVLSIISVFIIPKLHSIKNLIVSELLHPLGVGKVSPVTLTIAEYGTTTLSTRIQDLGFVWLSGNNSIGVNLLFIYAGALIAIYYVSKAFKHGKYLFLLLLPFIYLSNQGPFNWGLSEVSVMALFLIPALYIGLKARNNKKLFYTSIFSAILVIAFSFLIQNANPVSVHYYVYSALILTAIFIIFAIFDDKGEIDKILLYLSIFFLLTLILSNTEIRLIQPMELIGSILISYFVYWVLVKLSHFTVKEIYWGYAITAIFLLILVTDMVYSVLLASQVVQGNGSGLELWGPALVWIRNNTPVNSSLISWWDYGYWEEAIANRTAVADGANAYGYQSMIAKYLFTADSPYIYASYLNFIHRPNYFIISGSEVPKFTAITTIASNANKPIYLFPLPLYTLTYNSNHLGENHTNASYPYLIVLGGPQGIVPLQEAFNYNGLKFSPSSSYIYEVLVPWNGSKSANGEAIGLGQPFGMIYNSATQQVYGPLPFDYVCNYGQGCENTSSSGIPGAIELLNPPTLAVAQIATGAKSNDGIVTTILNLSQYGNVFSAIYVPNDTMNTLFAKLYLFGENVPGFKLVYSNGIPANSLLSMENEVITNVNVYEINYTELSQYILTNECSTNPEAINYCDNLSYLPSLFNKLIPNASNLYGV